MTTPILNNLFLNKDQIRELTGCARADMQIAWLRDKRYAFDIDAKGRPVVLLSHLEARLGGSVTAAPSAPQLRFAS